MKKVNAIVIAAAAVATLSLAACSSDADETVDSTVAGVDVTTPVEDVTEETDAMVETTVAADAMEETTVADAMEETTVAP